MNVLRAICSRNLISEDFRFLSELRERNHFHSLIQPLLDNIIMALV